MQDLGSLPTRELMARALQTKLAGRGTAFSLCTIINAKSGKCSEDCRFCTQSAHFRTSTPVYPLKESEEIIAAAREARASGAGHFSLVTSGRGILDHELPHLEEIIKRIRRKVDIRICASLGLARLDQFERLKAAGLSRYHHNLETSREHFPKVVTTHSFEERLQTIQAARQAGLEVCAGGIIGLGENEEDRISLAQSLAEAEVDSVPINILIPLAGTPLAGRKPLAPRDILRAIALFRLILPGVPIRLAAGRESALGDFLSSAFLAGADGMMIGGYLTQRGRSVQADLDFVTRIKELWSDSL